jgi:hypothetical protein
MICSLAKGSVLGGLLRDQGTRNKATSQAKIEKEKAGTGSSITFFSKHPQPF